MAAQVNNAVNAAQRGVVANAALVQSQNSALAGQNVSRNVQIANINATRASNSYNTAAKNLRKANMPGAANAFENAAKLVAVGRGVDAAKRANIGLKKMLSSN